MDFGAFVVWGLAAITFPISLIVGLVCYSRENRKSGRILWLPVLHGLFLTIGALFIYKVYFLDEKLVSAAMAGDNSEIISLLSRGADPNATWEDGRSAIEWAQENQHPDTVAILRAAGARE